jgi:hypothetical protein
MGEGTNKPLYSALPTSFKVLKINKTKTKNISIIQQL